MFVEIRCYANAIFAPIQAQQLANQRMDILMNALRAVFLTIFFASIFSSQVLADLPRAAYSKILADHWHKENSPEAKAKQALQREFNLLSERAATDILSSARDGRYTCKIEIAGYSAAAQQAVMNELKKLGYSCKIEEGTKLVPGVASYYRFEEYETTWFSVEWSK
jgi:hypothetical protein